MNFKEVLKEAIKNNTKIIITGKSGWGKSEMIAQVAEELGYELIDFRLSEILPEDLVGIPKLRDDYYEYVPPRWLYEVVNHPEKKYLLFLDEITQGTPEVLNICYKIFDKVTKIGDYTLPNVAVVGATNYADESNYLSELPQPLKNRACMLELDHDIDNATNYLIEKYNLDEEIRPVLKATIKESNPRSTEKAINLIQAKCCKQLVTPYVGLNNYTTMNFYLSGTGDQQDDLSNLGKARTDLHNGYVELDGKKYNIPDASTLCRIYDLSEEEKSLISVIFEPKHNEEYKDHLIEEFTSKNAELTAEELTKIIQENKSFNPTYYLSRIKLSVDTLKTQLPVLGDILYESKTSLLKTILENRTLPINVMREFKDILPWESIKEQARKGWLTENKLKEFSSYLV